MNDNNNNSITMSDVEKNYSDDGVERQVHEYVKTQSYIATVRDSMNYFIYFKHEISQLHDSEEKTTIMKNLEHQAMEIRYQPVPRMFMQQSIIDDWISLDPDYYRAMYIMSAPIHLINGARITQMSRHFPYSLQGIRESHDNSEWSFFENEKVSCLSYSVYEGEESVTRKVTSWDAHMKPDTVVSNIMKLFGTIDGKSLVKQMTS